MLEGEKEIFLPKLFKKNNLLKFSCSSFEKLIIRFSVFNKFFKF